MSRPIVRLAALPAQPGRLAPHRYDPHAGPAGATVRPTTVLRPQARSTRQCRSSSSRCGSMFWTRRAGWEITPIVVDGVMYLQDMLGNAFALDPETGKEIWRFSTPASAARCGRCHIGQATKATAPVSSWASMTAFTRWKRQAENPPLVLAASRGYVDIRDGFALPVSAMPFHPLRHLQKSRYHRA